MKQTTQNLPVSNEPEIESGFSLFKPSIAGIVRNMLTFFLLAVLPGLIASVLLIAGGGFGAAVNQSFVNVNTELPVDTGLAMAFLGILLISLVVAPALIHLQLESTRDKTVNVVDALPIGFKFLLRYLGLSIAVGFLIIAGLILFIIPGIFMLKRYILSPYYLVDQNLGVFEAMRRSAEDSKTFPSAVWPLIFVLILIFMISVVPIFGFIGSILTLLYSYAPAVLYHRIRNAG